MNKHVSLQVLGFFERLVTMCTIVLFVFIVGHVVTAEALPGCKDFGTQLARFLLLIHYLLTPSLSELHWVTEDFCGEKI